MTPSQCLRIYLAIGAARSARRLGVDAVLAARRAASLYEVSSANVLGRLQRADYACEAARRELAERETGFCDVADPTTPHYASEAT